MSRRHHTPTMKRTVRLAVLGLLLGLVVTAPRAQSSDSAVAAMEARIDSLRCEGRYGESVSVAEELLALRRQDPAAKSFEVGDAERLVATLRLIADLPEAAQKELAEADRLTADIDTAMRINKCVEGELQARRQLGIWQKFLGEESRDAATCLNNLALLLHACGNYAGAEQLLWQALAMWRGLLGQEHPDVAESINNLAMMLFERGDYAGAEPLFREALAMRRRLMGEKHPGVAMSLNDLAGLLQARGDYAHAEPLFREALAMQRELLGEENQAVARSLHNLAFFLQACGDYARAEPLFREALAMSRELLGEKSLDVATCLNNLAGVLKTRGDYAGAEALYRQSLEILTQLLGNEHPYVARNLSNLAGVLQARRDYAGAERLFAESLAMKLKLLGEEHPDVATGLHNLAGLLTDRGDYTAAEPLYHRALANDQRRLGNEHPFVATDLNHLGVLLYSRSDYADAERVFTEACRVHDAARPRVPVGQRRSTFQASPYPHLAAANLLLRHDDRAWPACERALGRSLWELLQSAEGRGLSSGEKCTEDSVRLALGDLERQLETFRAEVGKDSTAAAQLRVEEARNRLLAAEARWSAIQLEIDARHPVTEGQGYELARVQVVLRPDEAILGWLDVRGRGPRAETMCWGYVLRDTEPVRWQPLEPQTPVEDLPDRLKGSVDRLKAVRRRGFRGSESLSVAEVLRLEISRRPLGLQSAIHNAGILWEERFAPLMAHLSNVQHLIVIPSGPMLGIPVEVLPISGTDETVGDRFAVSYAPSATLYTWLTEKGRASSREGTSRAQSPEQNLCLAIGDPPFNTGDLEAMSTPQDLASVSRGGESPQVEPPDGLFGTVAIPEDGLEFEKEDELRGSALAGDREALSKLRRLAATRAEVDAVASLHGPGSQLLLGPRASEQELVGMAQRGELGKYRTIHFATHALVDDERPENSVLVLSQVDLPEALAAAMDGTRIYDGCLTAGEIVREWRLNADLVTLSACETALGKKVAGEGYIGLAHAFLQAGARSLLVSLWKVEDRSTAMLMGRFYENVLGAQPDRRGSDGNGPPRIPMSKVEGLREAKNWLREWQDKDGSCPYAHPYYWAGFVLIGEAH